ncbi:MAG: phosphoenolpyruvate carboxylase, partial [Cellulosimicrobium funkei]
MNDLSPSELSPSPGAADGPDRVSADVSDLPDDTGHAGRGLARHDVPGPLRDDVRLLGGLLGTVLRETGGQDLLDDVERLRELSIRAYDDRSDAVLAEAEALVEGLSMARAEQVARAF